MSWMRKERVKRVVQPLTKQQQAHNGHAEARSQQTTPQKSTHEPKGLHSAWSHLLEKNPTDSAVFQLRNVETQELKMRSLRLRLQITSYLHRVRNYKTEVHDWGLRVSVADWEAGFIREQLLSVIHCLPFFFLRFVFFYLKVKVTERRRERSSITRQMATKARGGPVRSKEPGKGVVPKSPMWLQGSKQLCHPPLLSWAMSRKQEWKWDSWDSN